MVSASDAIYTLRVLTGEALSVGFDRLPRIGGRRALPRNPEALTPEWLSAALQDVSRGVKVRSVRRLGGHSGTTDRARIEVRYHDKGTLASLPERMFVKMAPRDLSTSLFVRAMRLGDREVSFYRTLAPGLAVDVPKAYCALIDARRRRFVLVLEDLRERGCEFRGLGHPCAPEEASSVVEAFGRLHASFWQSARFESDLSWLPRHGRDSTYRMGRIVSQLSVRPAMSKHGAILPGGLARRIELVSRMRDRLEEAWARPPLTLVHGDPHVGNLYFSAGGVGFLDWQVVRCGQGMRDFAHYVITSLPVELRREIEGDLLRRYVDTLSASGVRGFTPEMAREGYRLHALYTWIAATVTTAAGTLQQGDVARAAMERSATAIDDLDSLGALEGLVG